MDKGESCGCYKGLHPVKHHNGNVHGMGWRRGGAVGVAVDCSTVGKMELWLKRASVIFNF